MFEGLIGHFKTPLGSQVAYLSLWGGSFGAEPRALRLTALQTEQVFTPPNLDAFLIVKLDRV